LVFVTEFANNAKKVTLGLNDLIQLIFTVRYLNLNSQSKQEWK